MKKKKELEGKEERDEEGEDEKEEILRYCTMWIRIVSDLNRFDVQTCI